jgi:mono/diheme cytochrome c family protein
MHAPREYRLAASRSASAAEHALLITLVLCTGCYRQQMAHQPGYHEPDQPSEFFPDGQANRPLETGTVARGQLHADEARFTGKTGAAFVSEFPYPVDAAMMQRGRERFNIYCAMCHGRVGRGDGKVVERGYIKPPSYHEARLRDMPVGQIFDTITHGHRAMPDYAEQISADDRWAIIAYVRALQLSQNVPAAQLTAEDKRKIEELRNAR